MLGLLSRRSRRLVQRRGRLHLRRSVVRPVLWEARDLNAMQQRVRDRGSHRRCGSLVTVVPERELAYSAQRQRAALCRDSGRPSVEWPRALCPRARPALLADRRGPDGSRGLAVRSTRWFTRRSAHRRKVAPPYSTRTQRTEAVTGRAAVRAVAVAASRACRGHQ